MYRYTRTYYSSNALTIPQLLPFSPCNNPIQSRFHGSLPLVSFVFYLSDYHAYKNQFHVSEHYAKEN